MKTNSDPRCEAPRECRAVGGALCRRCHMRSRIIALNADPEFAARNSERMKRLNADPEFAARNSERMKRLNADPEFAARNTQRRLSWCPEPLWELYRDLTKKGIPAREARALVEQHIRA